MKKLFKNLLIATASLGVVAGSTAAVVSCGKVQTDTPEKEIIEFDDLWHEIYEKSINPVPSDTSSTDMKEKLSSYANYLYDNDIGTGLLNPLTPDGTQVYITTINWNNLNLGIPTTLHFYITWSSKTSSTKLFKSCELLYTIMINHR